MGILYCQFFTVCHIAQFICEMSALYLVCIQKYGAVSCLTVCIRCI